MSVESSKIIYYDKVIIGAGLYGMYAALKCAKRDERVLVLECESAPFKRATFINQARVHMGYHYPRSIATALKSAGYFERFHKEFGFCINEGFEQIYATSANLSWTNAEQFKKFCDMAGIFCEEINPKKYFNSYMCDGAFLTQEYTYDAEILCNYFVEELSKCNNVEIRYGAQIHKIEKETDQYIIYDRDLKATTRYLLNATYASTNQIIDLIGAEKLAIKYELCEIILCDVVNELSDIGITVMDGPFFSIMPFGKTGYHSLTSVTFTPHAVSYDEIPQFNCQKDAQTMCTMKHLKNCNKCKEKPETAFPYMHGLYRKYMRPELNIEYRQSLFSMKPILKNSEIDDSRPTVVRMHSTNPTFVSVLSGKINTVYDLDEVL